jgi:glucosyl-dolichyl phosphate glucuronosyltransferase
LSTSQKQPSSPRATIGICTHNRADILRDCLESLAQQDGIDQARVLVIANNCTDHTPQVVESFKGHIPHLETIDETKAGVAYARARALAETDSEFLIFIDDDGVAEPGWLAAVIEAFDVLGADAVGGKILPYWKHHKPWWVSKPLHRFLSECDRGDGVYEGSDFDLQGCNMAFRTDILRKVGGFDTTLGVTKIEGQNKTIFLGEEPEAGRRVARNGHKVIYYGKAAVKHLTDGDRCTLRGMRARAIQAGRTIVRIAVSEPDLALYERESAWWLLCALCHLARLHLRNFLACYMMYLLLRSAAREVLQANGKRYVGMLRIPLAMLRLRKRMLKLLARAVTLRSVPTP